MPHTEHDANLIIKSENSKLFVVFFSFKQPAHIESVILKSSIDNPWLLFGHGVSHTVTYKRLLSCLLKGRKCLAKWLGGAKYCLNCDGVC